MTYKGADGGQELGLHGLLLREAAPDEDRVVGNLVRDFMRKAGERRRRTNERRRVEGRGHAAGANGDRGISSLARNTRWRRKEGTYASPSVL